MIKKLWNGDYSLLVTFWIFGMVGRVFSSLLSIADASESSLFFLIAVVCALAYVITWWVGVWRSADKYTGNQIWATLAKIGVVFSIACNVYYLF